MEFAARVNKEIGPRLPGDGGGGVTIKFISNVRPEKLAAARSRALPIEATSGGYAGRRCSR